MLAYKLQISVAKTVEFEKTEVYADTELEGISSPSTAVQKVRMLISIDGEDAPWAYVLISLRLKILKDHLQKNETPVVSLFGSTAHVWKRRWEGGIFFWPLTSLLDVTTTMSI
jgi:hypothetical protein